MGKKYNKNIWSFGLRELAIALIGTILYAVLAYATNILQLPGAGNVSIRPAVVLPMFFGIIFGPVVGFITGFMGNALSDLLSGSEFWFWWDLGNGLMGLIPGLFQGKIDNYGALKSLIIGELSVILGTGLGISVASLSEFWISNSDFLSIMNLYFLPAFFSNIVNGLILLPIMMVIYAEIVPTPPHE